MVSQYTQQPTICFFNSTKAWGGGEKWHLEMAQRLHEQGYRVLLTSRKDSELARRANLANIPVKTIEIGNLSFLNPFKLWHLTGLFKKEGITTVVMNLPADLKAAGVAARLANIRQIIYRRGSALPVKDTALNRLLFRYVLTGVIANSEATKKTLVQNNSRLFPMEKIRVIYNGLDVSGRPLHSTKLLYTRHGDEIILGNASRMVYQKGHDYLIDIARKLEHKRINFRLLLAGTGPLKQKLQQQVQQAGLADRVIFLGFVDDIHAFMRSIDIFLLTSRWEGFGFVLAEAMVASRPIVAFDISSNPELVQHGQNGFLAPPFDLEEFISYLRALIHDETLRRRLGKHGHQLVYKKFTLDRAVEEFTHTLFS